MAGQSLLPVGCRRTRRRFEIIHLNNSLKKGVPPPAFRMREDLFTPLDRQPSRMCQDGQEESCWDSEWLPGNPRRAGSASGSEPNLTGLSPLPLSLAQRRDFSLFLFFVSFFEIGPRSLRCLRMCPFSSSANQALRRERTLLWNQVSLIIFTFIARSMAAWIRIYQEKSWNYFHSFYIVLEVISPRFTWAIPVSYKFIVQVFL